MPIHDSWILAGATPDNPRIPVAHPALQAIFVRREAFPGFPELPLMEDVALSKAMKRRTRPACLREKVTTSGRRWESRGVVRTVLLMWQLRLLFFLGVSAEKLARRYER